LILAANILGATLLNYLTFPEVVPLAVGVFAIIGGAWTMDRRRPWVKNVLQDAFLKPLHIFVMGSTMAALSNLLIVTFWPHEYMSWSNPHGIYRVFESYVIVPLAWLLSVGVPACLLLGAGWYFLAWFYERRKSIRKRRG